MSLLATLTDFDPDATDSPAVALRVEVTENESEVPVHRHRKGQLVLAWRGGITCQVPNALWMVPPQCGVWVPGGTPHSNRVTANARIGFLYVEPGAARLPETCCTLSITPLVHELVRHLAGLPVPYAGDSSTGRLVAVLLEQLERMPVEQLHLPVSPDPRLKSMVGHLMADPTDAGTLPQWAARLAMSERSLARLILRETGLSFGRWRRQLLLIVALSRLSAGQSVQRVAGDLGYDSTTAFITMFKKALGKPPRQYLAERADGISI